MKMDKGKRKGKTGLSNLICLPLQIFISPSLLLLPGAWLEWSELGSSTGHPPHLLLASSWVWPARSINRQSGVEMSKVRVISLLPSFLKVSSESLCPLTAAAFKLVSSHNILLPGFGNFLPPFFRLRDPIYILPCGSTF